MRAVTWQGTRQMTVETVPIACGQCYCCKQGIFGACDNSNPDGEIVEGLCGATAGSAIFGYSHMYVGY